MRGGIADGVKRVQSHEARAQPLACPFDDLTEIGKIAAAPVTSGGQRIQLQGQPPIPLPDFEGRWYVALTGGNDQPKGAVDPPTSPSARMMKS